MLASILASYVYNDDDIDTDSSGSEFDDSDDNVEKDFEKSEDDDSVVTDSDDLLSDHASDTSDIPLSTLKIILLVFC